ncbi:MAG TPA: hypothetical protein VK780_09925 [Thermoanaerobaculia bacterium]|nr:hypothetical protein [Thermoanaerobaculia bacterium]
MSRLEISTDAGRLAFHPGEELRGVASWSVETPPTKVELRLFWRTEGKGSQDVGLVETLSFDGARPEERREFRLRLPPGPYSFSGKLISLIWALELVAEPGADAGRQDITISPTGREIVIAAAEGQP